MRRLGLKNYMPGAGKSIQVQGDEIAAGTIESSDIAPQSVDTSKLADGAVTEAKLADGAVTEAKLADGAVGEDQVTPEYAALLQLVADIPTTDPADGETIWNDNGVLKVASSG